MNKRTRRAAAAVGLVALLSVAGAGIAQAGTTNKPYNTTVGPYNGSGYTEYQTQYTSGASAQLHSGTVGGVYKVDVRVDGYHIGTWTRNVTDNDSRLLNNDNPKGKSVRLHFSNDLDVSKAVQVTGTWRSN
ncbi:hypothetical protein GCM10009809_04010 [Isoptericola hypogeus]|uniref:Uncharacterized protein n=1 Tax=Isoptericola hypogeus TaxID=300179 RepID=A0ABN2ISF5_9MICO